jgi:HEAT repeat protein
VPDALAIIFTSMGDESWRVRKEAVECYLASQPTPDSIRQLLELIRNEDNAGMRNSAAEAVVRLGSVCAPLLVEMIHDQDADVRKFVIDIMGAIADRIFSAPLTEALSDSDVNVASAAAEQLGNLGDSATVEALMQALDSRDDVLFRFSVLNTLSLLAKPAPVSDTLIKLADQDILKKAVFECLGNIADSGSYKLLLEAFSNSQKSCRAAAIKSLYKIYKRADSAAQYEIIDSLQLLKENGIIEGLVELYSRREPALTEALIWISIATRDARFIPLLIEAYTDERTSGMALTALKSFGRDALQEIARRYEFLDDTGKSGLCVLVAECGYSCFNDLILLALKDHSAAVRKAAAHAVGKLGLIALVANLVDLVDDPDPQVYSVAIASLQSLIMINRSAILLEVDQFYSSKLPHHRRAAAQLLAALGDRDRLFLLVKDEESQVRKDAVTAIGACRVGASAPMLVLALTDEDPEVRIAVADVLGVLQDNSALNALEHALDDTDVWVQSAVLKAIAGILPSRAVEIIAGLYTNAEGLLMITALQVLEHMTDAESERIIRQSLNSTDPDIARQAARSLERITVAGSCTRRS